MKQNNRAGDERILVNITLLIILLALGLNTGCQQVSVTAGTKKLKTIEITMVDPNGAFYGTFQSHNQKVVSNDNGIFMTYLHYYHDAGKVENNIWRLAQSRDGGKTFRTIYEANIATSVPVLETDAQNNLYLAFPEYNAENNPFYFMRFLASDNYQKPLTSKIYGIQCGGKFAMDYDERQGYFYIGTQFGEFLTVDMNGKKVSFVKLLTSAGKNASTQYPQVKMDMDGNIHHAWTTALYDKHGYWDIHHMFSKDEGITWENLNGTSIPIPDIPDDASKAELIILPDEFDSMTWLANMLPKDDKVHFSYRARTYPEKASGNLMRMHYVRYDIKTGKREIDTYTDSPDKQWRGEKISILWDDGFFATNPDLPNWPLYAISRDTQGYLATLISYDNGDTWHDFARSVNKYQMPYSIGGCSRLTADGNIIGSFVDRTVMTINFFCIKTR